MTQSTQKPVHTLRDGAIKIAIWRNQSEKGAFYSAELTRTYTDSEDKIDNSHSVSGTDILKAQRLFGKAYDVIARLRAQDKVDAEPDA